MGRKKNYIRNRVRRDNSLNPKELASCYGKIRLTKEQAQDKRVSIGKDKVNAYRCQFCKFYHVGRRPGVKKTSK